MDQYPYTAGSTTLAIIVPRWATEGGTAALQRRLADPVTRARIHRQVTAQDPADLARGLRAFEPENIVVATVPDPARRWYVGQSVAQIARRDGTDPATAALEMIRRWGGEVTTIVHGQSEPNLRRIMAHPRTAIASDGWDFDPAAGGLPHPRNYGTFPRVLGRYARDDGVLTLTEAVRKMTSLPAGRLSLHRRGAISPGYVADLVLFSPDSVADTATFERPAAVLPRHRRGHRRRPGRLPGRPGHRGPGRRLLRQRHGRWPEPTAPRSPSRRSPDDHL